MIVFRTDANQNIGMGHLMRCLSLAQEAKRQGIDCTFCVARETEKRLVLDKGFDCYQLQTPYNAMDDEIPQLEKIIKDLSPKILIVDGYFVTKNYFEQIRKLVTVAYIDDILAFAYPVDILINYNIYANEKEYRVVYNGSEEQVRYVLGPRFAPLREEFQSCEQPFSQVVEKVLISTGGADTEHVALQIMQYVATENERDIEFHFVIGALNKDLPQIEALAKQCENVVLHRNVTKMSELMRACDLAVSASGSTLYELCACGVPTVTYVLADNQVRAAKAFAEQGIMISIGDIREKPDFVKEIMLSINELRKNSLLRQTLREKMRSVTDGKGANYTITEIKNILKGEK